MTPRHRSLSAIALTLTGLFAACSFGPSTNSGGDGDGDPGDGDVGDGDIGDGDGSSSAACYEGGESSCQDVTWHDLSDAIDVLYAIKDDYAGYTKDEAKEQAKELFDHGVPQKAALRVLEAQSLGSGKYRAFVVVAGQDGLPAKDLTVSDFTVTAGGDTPLTVSRVRALSSASSEDVHAELSVVVDDSGSVQDCDASFVAQGLEHLFSSLPMVYDAQLLKFDDVILEAAARTNDGRALADAARHVCTARGATALWDAMDRGLTDLPREADLRAQVVFTDGLDNSSALTRKSVATHAAEDNTAVFVVALGYADVLSLNRLYDQADGALVYVPSGEKILRGFEQLTDFVLNTYVVEWQDVEGTKSVTVTATGKSDSASVHARKAAAKGP